MNSPQIIMIDRYCGDKREEHYELPPRVQTDENLFISLYMNSNITLGTPTEYFWDGFYAECEGQPLAAMPTETQERGWWASRMTQGERLSLFDGDLSSIEDDQEFIRNGGA